MSKDRANQAARECVDGWFLENEPDNDRSFGPESFPELVKCISKALITAVAEDRVAEALKPEKVAPIEFVLGTLMKAERKACAKVAEVHGAADVAAAILARGRDRKWYSSKPPGVYDGDEGGA